MTASEVTTQVTITARNLRRGDRIELGGATLTVYEAAPTPGGAMRIRTTTDVLITLPARTALTTALRVRRPVLIRLRRHPRPPGR